MATPKLKLGNDKWATKQRSLLAYNDEGNNFKSLPFNVERLSGGSYVGRNGLIQYAATEEPRIDFTNYSKGALLLEPQRLNYVLYSNEFDNSYWTKATSDTTANPTVTANAAIAPDGTQTADKIDLTAPPSGEWSVIKRDGINTGATVGSKLQQSLYLKAYDSSQVGKNVDVYMYDFSNTVYKTVYKYTLTADWQRVVVEHTITGANTSTNIQFAFGKARNTVGGSTQAEAATDFLVWGGQLEAGDYSTSYIPTADSTATRIIDLVTDGGNENVINNTAGTLFLDCELAARGTSSVYSRVMLCRDTSTTTRIILDEFNGTWRVVLFSGNTDASPNIVASSANTRIKLAITYDNTGVKTSYNGNNAVFTSGAFVPSTTMNKIKFSNAAENGSFFNGWVNDLQYFDEVLTDAELQALTT